MKTVIHKSNTRGHANYGWLNSWHTFSFARYYDPERVHFGLLRVLNDDTVAPGRGFDSHPHDNMEIISIPLSGRLRHKDSMGNVSIIKEGDVQIMSAGTGVVHSEYNDSDSEPVSFLQIWIFPKDRDIQPNYDQKEFPKAERKNKIQTVVSPEEDGSTLWINQEAWLALVDLEKNRHVEYVLNGSGHGVYIFVLEGEVEVQGHKLAKRDGGGFSGTGSIQLEAGKDSEVLLIEVPLR